MAGTILKASDIVLPVYHKWWHTPATYIVCKGSRGSGKSKQAALWLIYHLLKFPEANALVVRKVERTIRDSCFADLKWAIHQWHADAEFNCTVSPLEITRRRTGQKILFRGLDDGYKVTSIAVSQGCLCYLWCEEFYEIRKEDDFDIIDESIRGVLPEGYSKKVLITFNPWSSRHFAKAKFFDEPSPDVLAMTTTYTDNPYLSDTDRKLFERMRTQNPRRFQVAGLGEWGVVDGLVFENWQEQAFDITQVPGEDFAGLDWGYSNDPAAAIVGKCDTGARVLYIWDEIYKTGLTNSMLWKAIQDAGHAGARWTADSAEPKSIKDLKDYGAHIEAAVKGRDSINNGIQWLQDYQIIVHPRCVNVATELSLYSWKKDKFGKALNEPEDCNNHAMDAIRYGTERFRKHSKWVY